MSKHTEGPFKVVSGWRFEDHIFHAVTARGPQTDRAVAFCWNKPDADLFAAAQELLECLKDAILLIGDGDVSNRFKDAIAKAEGK
jgi:hypothetical protein